MRFSDKRHAGSDLFRKFLKKHSVPGSVLDIGCGKQIPKYLSRSRLKIYGIDPKFDKKMPGFKRAKAENIPFRSNMFNNIIFATSLDHIGDMDIALTEAIRVVAPGGRVFIWNRVSENLRGHKRVFTERQLENLLPNLIVKEDHRDITEGMFFCYAI